jgi:flagellar basal-body rod modification protein FlgD
MTDVSSATSAAATTATSMTTSSSNNIADDKEAFLKILLTQLENQNPLDPVDTTEFTNQLVAYSSLEQLMTMNEKLDNLIAAQSAASAA